MVGVTPKGDEPSTMHNVGKHGATRGRQRFHSAELVQRLAAATGVVALNMMLAGVAFGQTQWTGNTSNGWFNAGNWTNGVPTTGVTAIIDTTLHNPTEIRGTGATAADVIIGSVPGANGVLTVTTGVTPGTLTSSGVIVGNSGTGTLTVANGSIVSGPVVIANNAGSIGTLNISAGAGSPAVAPGTLNTTSVAFARSSD